MLLAPYSSEERGYVTLFPFVDIGQDLALALYRIGVRSDHTIMKAGGWGMIMEHGERRHLMSETEEQARVEAARAAFAGPVLLVRAVTRGRVMLYEKVERIELLSPAAAAGRPLRLVASNGVLVEKALNLRNAADFKALTGQLAGQLRHVDREVLRPKLEEMLGRMDVDWTNAKPADIDRAINDASKFLQQAATEQALPQWNQKIKATLTGVADGVRRQMSQTYLPNIGLSFTREETKTIEQIGEQQGWFLRNSKKEISSQLTWRGREIVQEGIRDGLGRVEIGRMLQERLPGMWEGMGARYAQVVAANGISRARSYSEVASYKTVGVTKLEVVAILDERTSDICRYMDGQIISVELVAENMEQAASVKKPEDIYQVSPFMRVENHGAGQSSLLTTTGTKIADIMRSGVGNVDDRGSTRGMVAGDGLPKARVGAPPYHHFCRSMTVPRTDLIQVPSGYEGRTVDTPPSEIKEPDKLLTMPPNRPVAFSYSPTRSNPVVGGTVHPLDSYTVHDDFFVPFKESQTWNAWTVKAYHPATNGASMYSSTSDDNFSMNKLLSFDDVFSNVLGHTRSAFMKLTARTIIGEEVTLASVISNPGLQGKDIIFNYTSARGSAGKQFIRISQVPQSEAKRFIKASRGGKADDAMAAAWLKDGEKKGWLKRGDKLSDVTKSQSARVGTVSRTLPPVKTKPAKAPPRPLPPPPPKVLPPIASPKEIPLTPWADEGQRAKAVTADLYNARPQSKQMVKVAWNGKIGAVRGVKVGAEGEVAKAGKWVETKLGRQDHFDFAKLNLKTDDHLVQIFQPLPLDKREMTEVYARIIETEYKRGFKGVREYIIQDDRGRAFFIRYDGARASRIGKSTMMDLIHSLRLDDEDALKILRQGVAESTTQLKQFYPKAQIDWNQSNLIPGVPIKEQTENRVAAIRQEITKALSADYRKHGTQTHERQGKVILDVLRRGASKIRDPSKILNSRQAKKSWKETDSIVGKSVMEKMTRFAPASDAKQAYKMALENASDGLLAAAQTRPMPTLIYMDDENIGFLVAGDSLSGVGAREIPGVIAVSDPKVTLRNLRPDFQHEFQHHLDELGMNGAAARTVRNAGVRDGKLLDVYGEGQEWSLPANVGGVYDTKVYGNDEWALLENYSSKKKWKAKELRETLDDVIVKEYLEREVAPSEMMTQMQTRLGSPHPAEEIGQAFAYNPDHVAVFIAVMRGNFVPY